MKFVAILKDSIRESLDTWSLRILFGLSTIAIVIVATFSAKPLSAEMTMKQFFIGNRDTLPLAVVLDSHKPEKRAGNMADAGQFHLVGVEQIKGETDAPDGEYRLLVASQGLANPDNGMESLRSVFKTAEEFNYIKIENIQELAKENEHARYLVTLQGTSNTHRIWACEPYFFLRILPVDSLPLAFQIYSLTALVMRGGEITACLLGVIITAFFIPNMLRKGSIDLMLAKPMARWTLITYKYVGGLAFMFFATAFAMTGIWLVLGIRTGFWANGLFLLIFTITFFFAILYAISTFVAVATRSAIAAILITIVAWALFFGLGVAYEHYNGKRIAEEAAEKNGIPIRPQDRDGDSDMARAAFLMHAITPRTGDLTYLNELIVFTDFMTGDLSNMSKFDTTKHNWVESVAVSLAWIIGFVGLAAVWFSYKDY
jgi:ABC-type transport system involved in multi-copper enzyme maturation permease subunit